MVCIISLTITKEGHGHPRIPLSIQILCDQADMGQTVLVLIVVPIYLLLPVKPTSSAQVLMKRMNVLSNLILDSS